MFHFADGNKIWHLKINEANHKVAKVFHEYSYDLKAVLSDDKKTYCLVQDRKSMYHIRIFAFNALNTKQDTLQQVAFFPLPATIDMENYRNTFCVSNCIVDGVIVHDANTMSRIYEDKMMPGIKYFNDYLPESIKGKKNMNLMTNNI